MTDLVAWRRCGFLRRGGAESRPGGRQRARSSPATWLAAAAGACGVGLVATSAWAASARAGGLAAATFVLVSGVAARVTELVAMPGGLVVRRAALRDRVALAVRVRQVVPPRWPLGAWRIVGDGPAISLMPSDVLGSEGLLAALVGAAGLRFDGRTWRRPAAVG